MSNIDTADSQTQKRSQQLHCQLSFYQSPSQTTSFSVRLSVDITIICFSCHFIFQFNIVTHFGAPFFLLSFFLFLFLITPRHSAGVVTSLYVVLRSRKENLMGMNRLLNRMNHNGCHKLLHILYLLQILSYLFQMH